MGSQSDWATMQACAHMLDALKIGHETRIVSAHRTPDRMAVYAKEAEERGPRIQAAWETLIAAKDAGAIFGFSRKKLSGSYCALIWLSRAMFAPYAFAANAQAVSSACPVKFVYVVPLE